METKDDQGDPEEDGYTSDFLVIESNNSTLEATMDDEKASTSSAETALGSVDITGDNIAAEPIVNVKINNIDVTMEVDTGAYVAAISKAMKEKTFPNLKIEKLNKSLNAYDKVKLEHEGIIKGLKVNINGSEATLSLVVMTHPGPTLIGRQWLKALGLWPIQLITSNSK
ncbi:unnamed protein product [Lasius platythorax]|uniref:Peptidase A2 domain-containing protein n=1 Tax=Lasius platythorax TaxID=488582 RepID=A0AAV2MX26_9HYME